MPEDGSNDNDGDGRDHGSTRGSDAHGRAAMLLVESLIHGLIARSVISIADAIEIIGTAVEVEEDIGEEMGETPASRQNSLTLLRAISASLVPDLSPGRAR